MKHNSLFKILIILILISLNWTGILAIGETFAFFSDTETSLENSFSAGTLDFSLTSNGWQPPEKAVDLQPGNSVTSTISVIKEGSLDFIYNASTTIDEENSNINFCNALSLKVELDSTILYNGTLSGLNFSSPVLISNNQDDLLFTLTLSNSYTPPEEGAVCQFKFIFRGWQDGLSFGQGFYDEEEIENTIENGGSITSGYSPIADSYVNQNDANKNYGGFSELQIRSENNKNKRTFIKFDFNFPAGTTILSSSLKLYLKSAPTISRNYEVWRVANFWTENGINWNNQPGVASNPTDSIPSGTTKNVWLSWNVTSDVQGFVDGVYSNYGWMLKDSQENSSTAYEAKFHSRESNNIELRPILEIQFSAPEATTNHPVINEVYYHVGTGKGKEPDNEWVEIYNPTDSPVDISGWKICDANACDTIPPSPSIPAKGFAVITYKASTWDKWSIPSAAIKIVLNSAIGNGLANSGDRVILKDASDTVVDAMSYGNDTTYFELPLSGKGKSLARIIKGYDTDLATDWIINATPNPGTNPSEDGVETLIFGTFGVAVAGWEPVLEEDWSTEEEIFEEILPEETKANEEVLNEEEQVINQGPEKSEESLIIENASVNNEEQPLPEDNSGKTNL